MYWQFKCTNIIILIIIFFVAEFAFGDLSGKFGVLNSFEKNYLAIYTDFNLPLFGVNSIIGRLSVRLFLKFEIFDVSTL